MTVSRRDLLLAGGGAAGIALLGASAYQIFRPHHAPTPYDDLLDLLESREDAARAGSLMTAIPGDAAMLAKELRATFSGFSLAQICARELDRKELFLADGWVVPNSLARLCALAARVKPA
jgi:hypothetical protein